MRAVLMAGGSGTRLRPLTCDLPKPMVPILNRPISEHIVNLLKRHGINEVIATLYYLPDVMRDYFQDGSDFFFVECGAAEGDRSSNTLPLEKELGWKGLLIEGNAVFVSKLLKKNRKAHVLPHCLSTEKKVMTVKYEANKFRSHISDSSSNDEEDEGEGASESDDANSSRLTCFPLVALLRALGVQRVDYFSLNIEGAEFPVLKTIPFDKVINGNLHHTWI